MNSKSDNVAAHYVQNIYRGYLFLCIWGVSLAEIQTAKIFINYRQFVFVSIKFLRRTTVVRYSSIVKILAWL